MPGVLIEACVASSADAIHAEEVGANRIELNQDLKRDGLTPTVSEVQAALKSLTVPLLVMIRPHDRGFVYSADELAKLADDVSGFVELGVHGVVFGPLTPQKRIDRVGTQRLMDSARGTEVVFHRAFDEVADPFDELEVLVDLGVTRVLTSGQAPTALDGIEVLRELTVQADGRIEILPGAGVGPQNASRLIRSVGCTQLHGSFRGPGGSFSPDLLRTTRRVVDDWA